MKTEQSRRNSQDARQVEPLVAVVKAVQGDYLGAAQAAASARQPPNQIYTAIDDYIGFYDAGLNWFSLSQRQALVGAVVFCAAMAGRYEDAAKIVRQQKYVPGLQNYANTNVAYAYLLQGNVVKALDAAKAVPVRNEQANDNGRAQILGLVMLEQIKRG
ncbi:MAG TPA: hypothetical protein VET30_05820, partial [Pseudoxanthomonas sp.]|nr:hypothetical protein [Pseudoxanthomonas sp.]